MSIFLRLEGLVFARMIQVAITGHFRLSKVLVDAHSKHFKKLDAIALLDR
jgi:hypothetical protein